MRMLIRYKNGLRVEAVLLAAYREQMRVAISSLRDTVELHRVNASWYTERGAAIEIEALIPVSGADIAGLCAAFQPRAMAAGRTLSDRW
jgi:hypothetical protein